MLQRSCSVSIELDTLFKQISSVFLFFSVAGSKLYILYLAHVIFLFFFWTASWGTRGGLAGPPGFPRGTVLSSGQRPHGALGETDTQKSP